MPVFGKGSIQSSSGKESPLLRQSDRDRDDVSISTSNSRGGGASFKRTEVQQKMSAYAVLKKNPWQKWKQHGRFPFKMVLHFCLLGVATLQVLLSNMQHADYYRASRDAFAHFLLPSECDISDKPQPYPWGGKGPGAKGRSYVCNLYTMDDTYKALKKAVGGFETLVTESVDNFQLHGGQNLTVISTNVSMLNAEVCNPFSPQPACSGTETYIWPNVTSYYLGPFEGQPKDREMRDFMERLKSMHVTAHVNTFEVGLMYTACITWEVEVGFDFTTRSEVMVWLHINIQQDWCDNTAKHTFGALFADAAWINWVTLIIGSPYLYLVALSIFKSFRVYMRIRKVIMLLERHTKAIRRKRKAPNKRATVISTHRPIPPITSADTEAPVDNSLRVLLARVGMPQLQQKLLAEGIATVADVLAVSPQELEQHIGLHKMQARKLMQAACNDRGIEQTLSSPSMPGIDPNWNVRGRGASGQWNLDSDRDESYDGAAEGPEGLTISWSMMKCADRLKFFRGWMIVSFFSAFFLIMGAIYRLYSGYVGNRTGASDDWGLLFMQSMGICLVWLNTIHYLEHSHEFYQLMLTLELGMPRVVRFLVGVFPILMAYALVGMIFFARQSSFFGTFGSAMITLFAVMNGDEMADSFNQVVGEFPVIGNIYWYSFVILFIFVVLNVFVAIVEAAHEATERLHWQKYGTPMVGPSEPYNEKILTKVMETVVADGRRGDEPTDDLVALEAAIQEQLSVNGADMEMDSATDFGLSEPEQQQTVRSLLSAVRQARERAHTDFQDL